MDHFYQTIDGWFDFEDVYRMAVLRADNGARFVEVGAWLGKSTAFMAVEIVNSGKRITFWTVDTWCGSNDSPTHAEYLATHPGDPFDTFNENMHRGQVERIVFPMRRTSIEASNLFSDGLDFVFLDASHLYEDVKADIESWLPKVKMGGILAGHDYTQHWPGVVQAVSETLGQVRLMGSSWVYEKPQ